MYESDSIRKLLNDKCAKFASRIGVKKLQMKRDQNLW